MNYLLKVTVFVCIIISSLTFGMSVSLNAQQPQSQSQAQSPVQIQEVQENSDEQETINTNKYLDTLLYGIDSSVVTILKQLINLKISGFETDVLTRMKASKNLDVVLFGYSYLREISYHNDDTINYSIDMINNYQNENRKNIQFAIYYLKDMSQFLNEEHKQTLLDLILNIIDVDTPVTALPALELVASIYSEKDTEIIVDNPEAVKELYSGKLVQRYEDTKSPIIKDQIITTIGEIEAYNQLDYIMSVIEKENIAENIKGRAIETLAKFTNLSDSFKEKVKNIYDSLRGNNVIELRIATFNSLAIAYNKDKNPDYLVWLNDGLRDNESKVRSAVIKSYYTILENSQNNTIQESLFKPLKYIIQNDPEQTIKQDAIKTISLIKPEGKDYLLSLLSKIKYLNSSEKALINVGLIELADEGGIDTVTKVLQDNVFDQNAGVIEYISEQLYKVKNIDKIAGLIGSLMAYQNTAVTINCINAIKRNNLNQFKNQLNNLSSDITQSKKIRDKAKQIADTL